MMASAWRYVRGPFADAGAPEVAVDVADAEVMRPAPLRRDLPVETPRFVWMGSFVPVWPGGLARSSAARAVVDCEEGRTCSNGRGAERVRVAILPRAPSSERV